MKLFIDTADVGEIRPDHLEEPTGAFEPGGLQERDVARLALAAPRAQNSCPRAPVGGGQLTVASLVLREQDAADPAPAMGRVNLAVEAVLAKPVGRIDHLSGRHADDASVQLGDRDVTSRDERGARVANVRRELLEVGAPMEAVGLCLGVVQPDHLGQIGFARVRAKPEPGGRE